MPHSTPLKPWKWIVSGLVIVALISVSSLILSDEEPAFWTQLETSLDESLLGAILNEVELASEEGDMEAELNQEELENSDVNLRIAYQKDPGLIGEGSQTEILHFGLEADAPYTLRYLSFELSYDDVSRATLQDPSLWSLYLLEAHPEDEESESAPVLVGVGEKWEDNLLRVRLTGEWPHSYFAEAGLSHFELTANIETTSDLAWVQGRLVREITGEMDWLWTPGHFEGSWLSLEDLRGWVY
jgi:hypothetical protein